MDGLSPMYVRPPGLSQGDAALDPELPPGLTLKRSLEPARLGEAPDSAKRFCVWCGKQVPPKCISARFCVFCGKAHAGDDTQADSGAAKWSSVAASRAPENIKAMPYANQQPLRVRDLAAMWQQVDRGAFMSPTSAADGVMGSSEFGQADWGAGMPWDFQLGAGHGDLHPAMQAAEEAFQREAMWRTFLAHMGPDPSESLRAQMKDASSSQSSGEEH